MSEIKNDGGSVTGVPKNELVFVRSADNVLKTAARLAGGRQMFAVTDENVARLHPEILPQNNVYVMPAGEDSKTLSRIEDVCRAMLNAGMTRNCVVVAFGGGVVGDSAGFAASVYMRGVDFINVPTTLLSQVDSAIGGKTGVNLDGYKNMIGAFKMPSHIVICPDVLSSLPEREWRCGMGELIKTAALDTQLYRYVEDNISRLTARDPFVTEKAVTAAATFKKKVTDDDPTEKGNRVILNFGHTVGHALEKCDNHRLSHGEYVMLGMKLELCMTDSAAKVCDGIGRLLAAQSLPALPDIHADLLCRVAKSDKKNGGGKIAVLGLLDVGKPYIREFSAESFAESYVAAVKKYVDSKEVTLG